MQSKQVLKFNPSAEPQPRAPAPPTPERPAPLCLNANSLEICRRSYKNSVWHFFRLRLTAVIRNRNQSSHGVEGSLRVTNGFIRIARLGTGNKLLPYKDQLLFTFHLAAKSCLPVVPHSRLEVENQSPGRVFEFDERNIPNLPPVPYQKGGARYGMGVRKDVTSIGLSRYPLRSQLYLRAIMWALAP